MQHSPVCVSKTRNAGPEATGIRSERTASLRQLSAEFAEMIRRCNRLTIRPPDRRHWFNGAYSTIKRILRDGFVPMTEGQKRSCAESLWSDLPKFPTAHFDNKAREIIIAIAQDYSLSIGQSQKLVSIFLKYAFVVYQIDPTSLSKDWHDFVLSNQMKFLVPIDSFVLFGLRNRLRDVKVLNHKCRTVQIIQPDGRKVSWSRISSFECYWKLQEQIRIISGNMIPLEYEMRNLWIA